MGTTARSRASAKLRRLPRGAAGTSQLHRALGGPCLLRGAPCPVPVGAALLDADGMLDALALTAGALLAQPAVECLVSQRIRSPSLAGLA